MVIQLYIKKDTIGLCFSNQTDRDLLWAQLGDQQNCAERFGERTLRFYPAKATASFNIALEAEMKGVFVEKLAGSVPMPPTPPAIMEVRVTPTAPAPIEPVAIIPAEKPFVEVIAPSLAQPLAEALGLTQPPPAMIEIPQVASLTAPQSVAKPPDLRSRAGREWKAQQEQIAKQQQLAAK